MSNPAFEPLRALAGVEALVHARQPMAAFDALVDYARQLQAGFFLRELAPRDPWLPPAALCARYAAAWGAVVLDPAFDIKRARLHDALRHLNVVHELVHGSAAGNLDGLLDVLRARTGGNYSIADIARILLLWVPGSRLPPEFAKFHALVPELATGVAIATVGGMVMSTPEAHAAREAAIAFLNSGVPQARDYDRVGFSRALVSAWMFCSYAVAADKHDVKRLLNAVVARLPAQDAGAPIAAAPPPADGRPVMVVPLEHFQSTHAMYRCYAPVLAACRSRFFMVGLAQAKSVDDRTRALFDVFHVLEDHRGAGGAVSIDRLAALVQSHAPAIVFYPGIGMQDYTILLANRRLAPVQAMTYGHPATSAMPAIDYGLTESQWIIDPARFTEKLVPLPPGTLRYAQPTDVQPVARFRRRDDVLRIAVPSVAQKWTGPFLDALARVRARLGQRVEFEFFAGVAGYSYPAAMHAVLRALPQARVHATLSYPQYTQALVNCDVHAATFPFGGTNSVFDSLAHGLPVVCLAPTDIHGAQDADFLRRAGLPDWLVARDIDGYVDTLVRLGEEPGLLAGLRAQLADCDRVRDLFVQGGDPAAFADALLRLAAAPG